MAPKRWASPWQKIFSARAAVQLRQQARRAPRSQSQSPKSDESPCFPSFVWHPINPKGCIAVDRLEIEWPKSQGDDVLHALLAQCRQIGRRVAGLEVPLCP